MQKIVMFLLVLQGIAWSDFSQDTLISWMNNGAPFDFILIDLRSPGEDNFTKVIANDQCTPYNLVWQDEFTQKIGKIGKDQHIVIHCRSGARATSAVSYLVTQGYTNVYNAQGFNTWKGPTKDYTDSVCLSDSLLPAPSMKAKTSRVVMVNHKNNGIINYPKNFVNVTNPDFFAHGKTFTITGKSCISNFKVARGIYCSGLRK
jgi:rhodanese-related sulfurtransferase